MRVKLKVSQLLRKFAGGGEVVDVEGNTPLECIEDLESRFPDVRSWLRDKQGELRPQFWVFVNGERFFPDELTKPLQEGDEISVLLAISGG